MRYLPIFIDTQGLRAVVLGGGRAAYIKIKSLLKTKLQVTVYARQISQDIKALAGENLVLHEGVEADDPALLDSADLLVIAFSGPGADHMQQAAQKRSLWTLRADSPEAGDFHLGMAIDKEPITIAVHTGGLGPMVGREVARTLDRAADTLDMERLTLLGDLRRRYILNGLHGEALTHAMADLMDLPVEELRAMEDLS